MFSIQYSLCFFMILYMCHGHNVASKHGNYTRKPELKMATNSNITKAGEDTPFNNNVTVNSLNATDNLTETYLENNNRVKIDIPKTMTVTEDHKSKDNINKVIILKEHSINNIARQDLNITKKQNIDKIINSNDDLQNKSELFENSTKNTIVKQSIMIKNENVTNIYQNNSMLMNEQNLNTSQNVVNNDLSQNDINNDLTKNIQQRYTVICHCHNVTSNNENITRKPEFKMATNYNNNITVKYLNVTENFTEIYLKSDNRVENDISKTNTVTEEHKSEDKINESIILKKPSLFDKTHDNINVTKIQELDKITKRNNKNESVLFEYTTKNTIENQSTVIRNETMTKIHKNDNILNTDKKFNLSKDEKRKDSSKNVKKRDIGKPYNIPKVYHQQGLTNINSKNHEIGSKIRKFYDTAVPQIQTRINNARIKKSFDEFRMVRRKTHFTLPNNEFKKDDPMLNLEHYQHLAYSKQYQYINEPRTESNREQNYQTTQQDENAITNHNNLNISPSSEEEIQLFKILARQHKIIEKLAQIERDGKPKKPVNHFDTILVEIEKKLKSKNYSYVTVDPTTIDTKKTTTAKPVTILTLFDETEIRLALKNDPLVKRILKMANMKRKRYLDNIRQYLGNPNDTHVTTGKD